MRSAIQVSVVPVNLLPCSNVHFPVVPIGTLWFCSRQSLQGLRILFHDYQPVINKHCIPRREKETLRLVQAMRNGILGGEPDTPFELRVLEALLSETVSMKHLLSPPSLPAPLARHQSP